MTTTRLAFVMWGICAACLFGQAAEVGSTNTVQTELSFEKSLFVYDDLVGTRDPFFPTSTRRSDLLNPGVEEVKVVEPEVNQLLLRGIMGTNDRRIALINNRTFEVGDELEVKVGEGFLLVRCIEFRQESVVVSVAGQPQRHELFVNAKVLPIKVEEEKP